MLDKVLQAMVLKILPGLERRVDELCENVNKEIGNVKRTRAEEYTN